MRQYCVESSQATGLSAEETQAAIRIVGDLQTLTVPAAGLFEGTLQIARTHDRTFYDSLYIAVAVQQRTQLIRADENLVTANTRLPVKWIVSLSG